MNEWIHQSFNEQMKENQYCMIHTTWRYQAFLLISWTYKGRHWKANTKFAITACVKIAITFALSGISPLPEEGRWEGGGGEWVEEQSSKSLEFRLHFPIKTRTSCDLAGSLTFMFLETWNPSSKSLISHWSIRQIPQNPWQLIYLLIWLLTLKILIPFGEAF